MTCSQALLSNSRTDMLPSEEAQASRQPHSCGAQDKRFTDAEWRVDSKTFWNEETWGLDGDGVERQIRTRPSYEEEARIVPNLGCAYK
jgi:hypothetical protein